MERRRLWQFKAALHESLVVARRNAALARAIAAALPQGVRVLDVGCGDGRLAQALQRLRSDLSIRGLDIEVRPNAAIEVLAFDGRVIPLQEGAVDVVLLCDVLHHVPDGEGLLREAKRVARRFVVIKDHFAESRWDAALLAFMDVVGNPRSVPQPRNYLSERAWRALWARVGLVPQEPITRTLALYRPPLDRLFDRTLHFVARLEHTA
jgi:SAM-dependent methyltransferase